MTDCINEVMTAREAASLWRLSLQTVSAALVRDIIPGRKSAGTWLITKNVMLRHYGPQPNKAVESTIVPNPGPQDKSK